MDFRNGYAVFEGRQESLTEFIHFRIQRYVFSQLFSRYFISFLRYFILGLVGLLRPGYGFCKDSVI